jgi:hypothetical protein
VRVIISRHRLPALQRAADRPRSLALKLPSYTVDQEKLQVLRHAREITKACQRADPRRGG